MSPPRPLIWIVGPVRTSHFSLKAELKVRPRIRLSSALSVGKNGQQIYTFDYL